MNAATGTIVAGLVFVTGVTCVILSVVLSIPYSRKWKFTATGGVLCLIAGILAVFLPH
jgi:hypothetical protein